MSERLVGPDPLDPEELSVEARLRPTRLDEFIGQPRLRERLAIAVEAARARGEPLDHVLLHGPPGLGKTTLAHVLANEMEAPIQVTSGPALERSRDMAAVLTNLPRGAVLFIDEIHRLHAEVVERLYAAMEDFAIDLVLGKGPAAKSLRLELQPFTLVGATTRTGVLTGPLRDRFGIVERVEYYGEAELRAIVSRAATVLGADLDPAGAAEIARRGRGTARVANRLLRRLRDFAEVRGEGRIDAEAAARGCVLLDVDALGLDRSDRRILSILAEHYGGGPVGLSTLAAASSEDRETIEDVIEPYLMQVGFLQRTPRGRLLTSRAYAHLGLKPPPGTPGAPLGDRPGTPGQPSGAGPSTRAVGIRAPRQVPLL